MAPKPFRTLPGRPGGTEKDPGVKKTVWFPTSLMAAIKAHMEAQGWSLQRFVREAVVEYLRRRHALPEKDETE